MISNKILLLEISLTDFVFLQIFVSEFSYIEIWFTDKNSKSFKIEDQINLTLIIN